MQSVGAGEQKETLVVWQQRPKDLKEWRVERDKQEFHRYPAVKKQNHPALQKVLITGHLCSQGDYNSDHFYLLFI